MMKNNYVVIMAGGIGSRFWPYSRNKRPKQFIDVLGVGRSLLQLTYDRFLKSCPKENIFIVSNEIYYDQIKEQLPDLKERQILLEPSRRNTAPCIAYAAYKIQKENPSAKMVVAPSDHIILNEQAFTEVVEKGFDYIESHDHLMTIGIKPTRPETGYGYIQYIDSEQNEKKVKTFTEKPAYDLAVKFYESGEFLWNAGIFMWNVKAILNAFDQYLPDMVDIFSEGKDALDTEDEKEYIARVYTHCKNISIDYGIMEKSSDVYVVEGDFNWSDLGSWASLHDVTDRDEQQNNIKGDVMMFDTKNTLVRTPKNKLVLIDGLDDYMVVEDGNVLVICPKSNESKFRTYVAAVKDQKGENYI